MDMQSRGESNQPLPLPTFLVIGAQKSATRWLRYNLGLHPDIFTASTEIAYFNNRERFEEFGLDWYREQFAGWSGEPIVGEATPGYMMWRHHPEVVAERIDASLPGVRLVATLRNPVDRAQSALVHHTHGGAIEPGADLLEIAGRMPPEKDPLGIVAGGWYAASLAPYHERFGSRLLVVLHDEVVTDPRNVYQRALQHVGGAAGFEPPELAEVRFSRQTPASAAPPKRSVTGDQYREMYAYFSDDVDRLETMFGLDLSSWRPGAGAA
jgi:hypothetical protein